LAFQGYKQQNTGRRSQDVPQNPKTPDSLR
jgi:hypothetical protein